MSMMRRLNFRLRAAGYDPRPEDEPMPVALKVNRLLKKRDVVDQRTAAIETQIEWHHAELRRLEDCKQRALGERDQINADIKSILPW